MLIPVRNLTSAKSVGVSKVEKTKQNKKNSKHTYIQTHTHLFILDLYWFLIYLILVEYKNFSISRKQTVS